VRSRRWKGASAADLRQHVIQFDTPVAAASYHSLVKDESNRFTSKFADDSQLICGHIDDMEVSLDTDDQGVPVDEVLSYADLLETATGHALPEAR
jgi:hypothetical protein